VVRVTTYKNGQLRRDLMTWQQSQKPPTEDVDLYINMVQFRVVVYRPGKPPLVHQRRVKHVGYMVFCLLPKLLRRPGYPFTTYDIAQMQPIDCGHSECLETYVCRIRKWVFGENGRTPRFILTEPGPAYAFNGSLSFRLIERVAPSEANA
jgi:hypothetical protein